mgnify:CR=1 FL=1
MLSVCREQFRNNLVAIISPVVAVTSLSDNRWRDEASEYSRNVRQDGVLMLIKLGELQAVLFHSHRDRVPDRGKPGAGQAHVLVITDAEAGLPESVPAGADHLLAIGERDASAQRISAAIDELPSRVFEALQSLE